MSRFLSIEEEKIGNALVEIVEDYGQDIYSGDYKFYDVQSYIVRIQGRDRKQFQKLEDAEIYFQGIVLGLELSGLVK